MNLLWSTSYVPNIYIRVEAAIMDSAYRTFPSFQKVILDSAVLKTMLWGRNHFINEEIRLREGKQLA